MKTLDLDKLSRWQPSAVLDLSQLDDEISKAVSHKYISRTKKGKRYVYKYPAGKGDRHGDHSISSRHLPTLADIHKGAAFAAGKNRGHYLINQVDGDKVTFHLDENTEGRPGKVRSMSKGDFLQMISAVHGDAAKNFAHEGLDKRLDVLERAKIHGTEVHVERAKKHVQGWLDKHGQHIDRTRHNEALALTTEKTTAPQVVDKVTAKHPEIKALEDKARSGEKLTEANIDNLSRARKRPVAPNVSVALSPDKKHSYHVQHKVVPLEELITSHSLTGSQNEAYTQDLQSRHRGSVVDKQQIATMAGSLDPMALLWDSRRTDEGSPIIGEDNMVESGNGRSLALQFAAQNNNKAWQNYQSEMKDYLPGLGLSEKDLEGIKNPVIVRERVTGDGNKDFRVDFAEKANTSSIKRMSASEEAQRDSNRISPEMLFGLKTKEGEGIDAALSRAANGHISRKYLETMPSNESAALLDASGNISRHGRERMKAALYLYALPGETGSKIAQTFVEASDHDLRNFDAAFSRTLPQLAMTRALFEEGSRDKKLDIMPDLATAISTLDEIKRHDVTVDEHARQIGLFGSVNTPLQIKMMKKLDELKRSPKKLHELLNSYTQTIEEMGAATQIEAGFLAERGGMKNPDDVWAETVRKFDKTQESTKKQASLF